MMRKLKLLSSIIRKMAGEYNYISIKRQGCDYSVPQNKVTIPVVTPA